MRWLARGDGGDAVSKGGARVKLTSKQCTSFLVPGSIFERKEVFFPFLFPFHIEV